MFAKQSRLCVLIVGITISAVAHADDGTPNASKLDIALTQEAAPESKPWEDPARISITINPDGPDQFSIQTNLEIGTKLTVPDVEKMIGRKRTLGGYVRYQRESGGEVKQNNLEFGGKFSTGYDIAALLAIPTDIGLMPITPEARERLAKLAEKRGKHLDVAYEFSSGYARTASYPDLKIAPCSTTSNLPQCATQTKESIRTSLAGTVFWGVLEDNLGTGLAYSISPKFGIDHDLLLNSPLDSKTGLSTQGGYLSAVGGIGIVLTPSFVNPGWELKATAQVRKKVQASTSRSPNIENFAEKFEASATYYFIRPSQPGKKDWRAGIGMTFSAGGDPLTGKADEKKFVIAFRLGKY